ncbi:hypothetical protein [Cedecea lapagei]|uniref:hypothetical protein n=1 Tax=Cedecea lapagei TaxID=158823 RepID=UPI001BCAC486|nr:hypothetical protein [Cedecea lapagei]
MREFNYKQTQVFLNSFGEEIKHNGGTFTAIVEVAPIAVDGTDGTVIGERTYLSARTEDISKQGVEIGTEITVRNQQYIIYESDDDLSGMINLFFRSVEGQDY